MSVVFLLAGSSLQNNFKFSSPLLMSFDLALVIPPLVILGNDIH